MTATGTTWSAPEPVLEPVVAEVRPPGRPARAFPGLDAVRALGATAVVATHVAFETGRSIRGPLSGSLARADFGVALFFALSGFLLFRPFASAAVGDRSRWPRTGDYLLRRGLRILPAYWLAVVACLLLIPANAGRRGVEVWVRHLTLTQVYTPGLARFGLTQMWSLCTEVAFYLALPLLALLVLGRRGRAVGRRPLVVLAALASVAVGWQVVVGQTTWVPRAVAGQWLPGYLDWFGAGMALALVQVRLTTGAAPSWMHGLRDLAATPGTCWASALAVFALATSPVAGPRSLEGSATTWEAVTKNLLFAVCAALLLLPLVLGDQRHGAARTLGHRSLQLLGEVSYGVFLWHLLVLDALVRALHWQLFQGSWTELFALTWTGALAAAALSYV
ncbi:MAG: acyltransferase family protein, partial [Mycobacteriales bacterium]